MEDVKPNVLVPKIMLQSVFRMRGVEYADWEKDWGNINSFYCRTSLCVNCVNCQLECQNYDSSLNIITNSWRDCDYPYGFKITNGLSSEQQAIIAIIVVLAIIFVICGYYLLLGIFLQNANKYCITCSS